jgi:two-component system, cell cycle sensor histidine kinase and response regulator CckA
MDPSKQWEAIGRSAGVTAHDFNNLLTIILGYTSLLLRTLPENDPSRASIEEIQLAAERGRKLTQELSARYKAASMAAGEVSPNPRDSSRPQ